MMSGHGANPIFFNKKNWRWGIQKTHYPQPPTSNNISFFALPTPTPPKSGGHIGITLYYTFAADAYDNRKYLEDVLCFYE